MPLFQTPLSTKRKSDATDEGSHKKQNTRTDEYWLVQWRFPQGRKHKSWEGDGVLEINDQRATLYDSDGKKMGSGTTQPPYSEGVGYAGIGGRDIELERQITKSDFMSGKCFGAGSSSTACASVTTTLGSAAKQYVAPKAGPSTSRSTVSIQPTPSSSQSEDLDLGDSFWTVNWRKTGHANKNRPWDGDGFLSLRNKKLTLVSEQGKSMGKANHKGGPLIVGTRMFIGNVEIQLDAKVSASQIPGATKEAADDDEVEVVKTEPAKKYIAPTNFYGAATPKVKVAKPLHDPDTEDAVVMKAPTKEHIKRFNKQNLPVVPVVIDPILSRKLRPHQVEGVKFMYESVMGLRKHEGQGCLLADDMGLGKTLQTIALIWTLLKQNPYGNIGPAVQKVLIVCPVSLVNNWRSEIHKWLGRDRLGVAVCDKDKIDNIIAGFMNSKSIQVLVIGYERLRTIIDRLTVMVPPIGLIICDEGHRLKSANNKTNKMFTVLKTPRRVILSGTPIQNDLSELHAMSDFCNPGLLDDYSTFRRVYETPIVKSRAPDSTSKEVQLGQARSEQLSTITKSFVLRREAALLNNWLPPKHEYIVFVKPTALQREIFNTFLNPSKGTVDDLASGSTAESLAMINLLIKVSNDPILLRPVAEKDEKENQVKTSFRHKAVREAVKLIPVHAKTEDVNMSGKLMALAKLLKTVKRTTEEKVVVVSHYTATLDILEAYCNKKGYSYYRLDGQTQASKRQEHVNRFNKGSQRDSFIFLLSSKAGGVGINLIGGSRLCLLDTDWNPSHDLQAMARCHRDGQKRPVHIYRFMTAGAIDEKIYQRQVTKLGLSNSLIGSDSGASKSDSFTPKELKDIFTVQLSSPCNTHDLLECQCSAPAIDDRDAFAMDVDLENDVEDSGDGEKKGFMSAAQVTPKDVQNVDKDYMLKKKSDLASLSEWEHINCLSPTAWTKLQDGDADGVLTGLLHWGADPLVPNPTKSLLETLDDKVADLTWDAAKGGTVGFVFKKTTTSKPVEEESEEPEEVL